MAFELEVLFRAGVLECRFQVRGDDALAVRVDVGEEVALGIRRVALAALAENVFLWLSVTALMVVLPRLAGDSFAG